jgi:hypothetical protein
MPRSRLIAALLTLLMLLLGHSGGCRSAQVNNPTPRPTHRPDTGAQLQAAYDAFAKRACACPPHDTDKDRCLASFKRSLRLGPCELAQLKQMSKQELLLYSCYARVLRDPATCYVARCPMLPPPGGDLDGIKRYLKKESPRRAGSCRPASHGFDRCHKQNPAAKSALQRLLKCSRPPPNR